MNKKSSGLRDQIIKDLMLYDSLPNWLKYSKVKKSND